MELNLKQELEGLVIKLVAIGEDEKELKYWISIFDDMNSDEQEALIKNLKSSLIELSAAALEK